MDVLSTKPLPLAEWLAVIEREYLRGFVPAGGAAVKLALLDDDGIETAAAGLVRLGPAHAMQPVRIDAARTRISLIHEVLFAVTRALDWDSLLQYYIEQLFTVHDYPWPRPGAAVPMTELAVHFGVAPSLLARQRDQWLTADLWDDRRMSQDVRAALLRLVLSRLEPDASDPAAPAMQWLRGEKVPASVLRLSDISVRIGRTNARATLGSVCRFVRKAGLAGLLLVLDVRALSQMGAEVADGALRYSPAAVMDSYEVLRELIDETEQLPGLFVAVLGNAALTTGEPRRVLSQYAALQMRVWPDVRPGDRQNPVAPLVWLSA